MLPTNTHTHTHKVSFLLYDLKTRLGAKELGTCSALTAGGSRADHFTALKQLKTILGACTQRTSLFFSSPDVCASTRPS